MESASTDDGKKCNGGWMGPMNYKHFPTNAFFLALEINVGD